MDGKVVWFLKVFESEQKKTKTKTKQKQTNKQTKTLGSTSSSVYMV